MRHALVLLGFAFLSTGCVGAPAPAASSPAAKRPPAALAQPESLRPRASGCRAVPSTVYGDEPVVFEIEGAPVGASIDVELADQRGHPLAKATSSMPGQWRPSGIPSGDFTLSVGPDRIGCTVTVNRELSRATSH